MKRFKKKRKIKGRRLSCRVQPQPRPSSSPSLHGLGSPAASKFPTPTVLPLRQIVKSFVFGHLPEQKLPGAHEPALNSTCPRHARIARSDPEIQTQCHQPIRNARPLSFGKLNPFLFGQLFYLFYKGLFLLVTLFTFLFTFLITLLYNNVFFKTQFSMLKNKSYNYSIIAFFTSWLR